LGFGGVWGNPFLCASEFLFLFLSLFLSLSLSTFSCCAMIISQTSVGLSEVGVAGDA